MVIRGDDGVVQSEIRRRNLSRMLSALHLDGPQSRSRLATTLRVNRSTVASLAADLAARGLVYERPRRQSIGQLPGRPSPVVEIAPDGPAVVALELSTDWLRAAIVSLGGSVVAAETIEHPVALMRPAEVVDRIHALATPLYEAAARTRVIVGVGVSVPGGVRQADGFVTHAPNLGWANVALGDMLRAKFGALPVAAGNDADLAALAEHLRGSGRGSTDFVCLWGEGGIGAGFVVGGRPLTGAAGLAGEVGHLTVNPDGAPCHCGARGCWEAEVGEEALLRRSGRSPLAGSEGLVDLLRSAGEGDERAQEALEIGGRWLGIGIAGLINVFNPSRVALGGIYARIYPHVRAAMAREIETRAMPAPRGMVEIVPVKLGAQALLLGAAELALAPILADPTTVALQPTLPGRQTAPERYGVPSRQKRSLEHEPSIPG